jgi:alkylhydroperoxidase/carboxymuconolactone decarboxylase family protein YurZ
MNTAKVVSEDERSRIRSFFIGLRGYWRPWTETMLEVCPDFVSQYARYAGHTAQAGALSQRMVELIYVALDASASHLFETGLHTHMKRALEVAATPDDIFDVLHLVTVQGVSSACQAADILAEFADPSQSPAANERLQSRIDRVAPAHALALASMARLDPAYAEVLLDFVEHGRPGTGLSPAERSLVQLALHACFTAFNPGAVRQIVATALSQGLVPAELLQAIQLGAHLAVHGTALGANVYRQMPEIAEPAAPASKQAR